MIIDIHEHNHYEIVDVIWFAVIDDSEGDIGHVNTEGGTDDITAISDGSGKPCVIVLSYKNCISYRTHCKSVCKKMILLDLHIIVFVKWFLMLLRARNCVCLFSTDIVNFSLFSVVVYAL